MSVTRVRVDVWGGSCSQELLAHKHFAEIESALPFIGREIAAGFLVNSRILEEGEGWGPEEDFDDRPRAS